MSLVNKEKIQKTNFGIEDFLNQDGKSFFETIFSTRHIGRVIDFFRFECEPFFNSISEREAFEYRFRAILETGIFFSFSNNKAQNFKPTLEIEVGFDLEKIVISLTSTVAKDFSDNDIKENLNINFIQKQADGLLIRHSKKSRRIQLIAFILKNSVDNKSEIEIIEITDDLKSTANTHEETNNKKILPFALANDVDAFEEDNTLSKNLSTVKNTQGNESIENSSESTTAINEAIENSDVKEPTEVKTLDSSLEDNSDEIILNETVDSIKNQNLVRIKGTTEKINDESVLIKGKSLEEEVGIDKAHDLAKQALQEINFVIDGSKTDASIEKTKIDEELDSEVVNDIEESAQVLSDQLRSEIVDVVPELSKKEFNELFLKVTANIRENYLKTLEHVKKMHDIQLEAKVKHYADKIAVMSLTIDQLRQQCEQNGLKINLKENQSEVQNKANFSVIDGEENKKFQSIIIEKESDIEKASLPDSLKKWAKSLLSEVLTERGEFNKKIREYDVNLRKNIHEFKTKENTYLQQLQIKDELLKQKDLTLKKTKEALHTALATIERYKEIQKNSKEAEATKKLYLTEKLLGVSKQQNEKLSARIEEMTSRWQSELNKNIEFKKQNQTLQKENSDLRKQIEDLKTRLEQNGNKENELKLEAEHKKIVEKLNQQIVELQSKINQQNVALSKAQSQVKEFSKKVNSTQSEQQWQLKLERATKLLQTQKEDLERMRKRYDELKKTETQLRHELAQLQTKLKIANSQKKG
jgi:nucleoprotein TPR